MQKILSLIANLSFLFIINCFSSLSPMCHTQNFTQEGLYRLLEKIETSICSLKQQENTSSFDFEQSPELAEPFDSIFSFKEPIISFDELNNLIDLCIEKLDKQIKTKFSNSSSYLQKQSINSESKIFIVGDIHGSAHSLIKIIKNALPQKNDITKFVFLGDYSDRGIFGAEVFAILLYLKLLFWNDVFLLRGNHECKILNLMFIENGGGFTTELIKKYPSEQSDILINKFDELYNRLPLALYLGTNQDTWVQFCHGGFHAKFNPQIFLTDPSKDIFPFTFKNPTLTSALNGFVWGDFYLRGSDIVQDISLRGSSELNDIEQIPNVLSYLSNANIKAIFRGHQHSNYGFKMFPKQTDEFLAKQYSGPLGLEPIHWEAVINQDMKGLDFSVSDDGDKLLSKIRIAHYIPIFTFSTATEHGCVPETCYGILETADNYFNWFLQPVFIK